MCPCQGSATGVSQIAVQVPGTEQCDDIIERFFADKLVIEATFSQQVRRKRVDDDKKEKAKKDDTDQQLMTLTLVTSDDRVDGVLSALEKLGGEGGSGCVGGGEPLVSPLLTGKKGYMDWVQGSLSSSQDGATSKFSTSPMDLDFQITTTTR